jgi:hypothetical protein
MWKEIERALSPMSCMIERVGQRREEGDWWHRACIRAITGASRG